MRQLQQLSPPRHSALSTRHSALLSVVLALVVAACFSASCKRRTRTERDLMARLAGSWVWRQAGVPQPTVVVLKLTARGKFERTTYRQVGATRKLLYMHPFTKDMVVEPESPEAIAKLKKERYEPAMDRGRYMVSLQEKSQRIVFEGASATRFEVAEGSSPQEQPLTLHSQNQLVIGGRTYERETPTPAP